MAPRQEEYIVLRRSGYMDREFPNQPIRLSEDGYFKKLVAENVAVDEELTQKLNAVMTVLKS